MSEYSRELVAGKVKRCFPNDDHEKIMAVLDLYGTELYEQERERVQIAILKLSGGDVEELRENVRMAKSDFRDVLAYAEYPEEMRKDTWQMTDNVEVGRIRERDRGQYLAWLNS